MKYVAILIALFMCGLVCSGCNNNSSGKNRHLTSDSPEDPSTPVPDPGPEDPSLPDPCELLTVEVKDCYRLGEDTLLQIREDEVIGCYDVDVSILTQEDAFTIGIRKDWKSLVLIRFDKYGGTILYQSFDSTFAMDLQPVEINLSKKELRHYRLGVELCYKPDEDEHDHRDHRDCRDYNCGSEEEDDDDDSDNDDDSEKEEDDD